MVGAVRQDREGLLRRELGRGALEPNLHAAYATRRQRLSGWHACDARGMTCRRSTFIANELELDAQEEVELEREWLARDDVIRTHRAVMM